MKIGDLSKQSGIAAHTIRFYESKGLLPKAQRGMNGYRFYEDQTYERLLLIQCAKSLGFSLDEILALLLEQEATNLDHDKIMAQLNQRLNEVDVMMNRLVQQKEDIQLFKNKLQQNWLAGKCMKADEMTEFSKQKNKQ